MTLEGKELTCFNIFHPQKSVDADQLASDEAGNQNDAKILRAGPFGDP